MEQDRFKKTRRMILVRALLPAFAVLMLVCTTLVYYFGIYSRDRVKAEMETVVRGHLQIIDRFLEERAADLRLTSASYDAAYLSEDKNLARVLRNLQAGSNAFFDVGVFDKDGNHLAYVGPYDLAGKKYSDAPWWKAVKEKGIYVSDVFLGFRNIPHFIVAVRGGSPEEPWYLRATIDSMAFNDLVESVRIGKTGEAYLVSKGGLFQTKRRSGGNLMDPDPDFEKYESGSNRIETFTAVSASGDKFLFATGELKMADLVLVVRQETDEAYAPVVGAVTVASAIILGGGGLVAVLSYILASYLAGQLSTAERENRQMRTQLIIAGKLAELGEMSAGVAHEINNPLQVMKSEHTLISDLLSDAEEEGGHIDADHLAIIKDSVDQIALQIDRCKNITQGLLRFARKSESSMEAVSIQGFLPTVVDMVEHQAFLSNIKIIQELDPDLPSVMSDPNQLQQVFLNLLNNAIHAIDGRQSGEVRIRAGRENSHLKISVTDNGCGIKPEDMEKIFLPFFTTKPVGQGTGLGLSTAYGIVKGLGGEIDVTSELNAGTVFTVTLPIEAGERAGG